MNAWNLLSNVKMLPRSAKISTDLTSVSVEKDCTGSTTNAKVCRLVSELEMTPRREHIYWLFQLTKPVINYLLNNMR